jgi:hypothetical protein
MAKRFISLPTLRKLFDVPDPVVVTGDGEEVAANEEGLYPGIEPGHMYMVFSEKEDVGSDQEQELTPEMIAKRRAKMKQRAFNMEKARREMIAAEYKPRHPELYGSIKPAQVLVPSFLNAVLERTPEALRSILKKESDTGLYSFDMLLPSYCELLLDEIAHYDQSGLPIVRPNSMNNYGVVLDEMGMYQWLDAVMRNFVRPFAALLYAPWGGDSLDSHHGFVVQYKIGEDTKLDFHYDDSEVTLNVCLGRTFEGGSLFFRGLLHDPSTHNEELEFQHVRGRGLLHLGKHRHGANDIRSGERYNLILWCRSSSYREQAYLRRMQQGADQHECACGHEHAEPQVHHDSHKDHVTEPQTPARHGS